MTTPTRKRTRTPKYTPDDATRALRAFAAKHRRAPTLNEWKATRAKPSLTVICRMFGSWNAAVERAGLTTRERGCDVTAFDAETARVIERLRCEPVTIGELAHELGMTGQALGRRIARYRARHGLPADDERSTRRGVVSMREREHWQLTHDPSRAQL